MSTTVPSGGSAKIYQFPLRGRFAANAQQTDTNVAALSSLLAPRVSSGSWYHEEAIEAERAHKN